MRSFPFPNRPVAARPTATRLVAARSRLVLLTLVAVPSSATLATGQAPAGYYDGVDSTDSAALRTTLHAVIDDHQRFPYTSSATDTWNILELADENPTNSNHILDIYKNTSVQKFGAGNSSYNREHSWPKSYGFPHDGSSNYPYTDCHQLFLCNSGYNSSRSNKPYRDCSATCSEKITEVNAGSGGGSGIYPGNSNWTSGSGTTGTWETWGDRRGNVARALMYLDLRYEGGAHGVTGAPEPDLILTDNEALIAASNTGSNESVAYMGLQSVLYAWHLADPVDAFELQHNEAVYAFQGNRNPFVDNAAWVDCLFGSSCNGGGNPPGGGGDAWINELHYDNSGSDTGEGIEVAGAAGTNLSGWTLELYNGNGGTVYGSISLGGTIADQQAGYGTVWFASPGLQNGAPDGIALVDDTGALVQFLSYEGSMTANSGSASGETSENIGVSETSSTPAGWSLQIGGTGGAYADFAWQSASTDSPGSPNAGQTFSGSGGGDSTPPAVPSGLGATAGNGVVALDWSNNNESDLAGYNVYRATSSGGSYTQLNSGLLSQSDYSDSSVNNGTTYYYAVTAEDLSANESANSSQVNATPTAPPASSAWINELHYDDKGSDSNEGVEIAGSAGLNLSGWTLVAYNGNGGGSYNTKSLSGTLSNQQNGYGTSWFGISGLQNGAPDGVALVDNNGSVVQFLSYEGSLTATNGPAAGLSSEDIGVSETSSTKNNHSLRLTGSGSSYADFSWQGPSTHSRGSVNSGQTLGT